MSQTVENLWNVLKHDANTWSEERRFDLDRKTDALCFFDAFSQYNPPPQLVSKFEILRSDLQTVQFNIAGSAALEKLNHATKFETHEFESLVAIVSTRILLQTITIYCETSPNWKVEELDSTIKFIAKNNFVAAKEATESITEACSVVMSKNKKGKLPLAYEQVLLNVGFYDVS